MTDIAIIGAGRLGTCLGTALTRADYRISSLTAKTIEEAEESRQIIGQGEPGTNNRRAAKMAELIILTVPDDLIEKVADEMADPSFPWANKQVFHCSGLYSSRILKSLKKLGAVTASFHPVQTFPYKSEKSGLFKNIYVSLEGDPRAMKTAEGLITKIGARTFPIKAKDKPVYHLACSIASNLLVTFIDIAIDLIKRTGFSEEQSFGILFPLIKKTLQNVKDLSVTGALTGPVKRGDVDTIEKHLESLKELPDIKSLYLQLTSRALDLVEKESGPSSQKLKDLKAFLEGK
jgi:predicted short-subunit dehydrogenase-like oxidoreductase (DUF2520 family)